MYIEHWIRSITITEKTIELTLSKIRERKGSATRKARGGTRRGLRVPGRGQDQGQDRDISTIGSGIEGDIGIVALEEIVHQAEANVGVANRREVKVELRQK